MARKPLIQRTKKESQDSLSGDGLSDPRDDGMVCPAVADGVALDCVYGVAVVGQIRLGLYHCVRGDGGIPIALSVVSSSSP